jgi:undecaprenyl-diphosphatase
MWPGVSRSLVTIIAALLMGVAMDVAVEFSFLLGFITLSAATVYDLAKHGNEILDQFGVATPLLGIVVAGVAAFASVKFMISWLSQRGLALFGWYRIAAGIAAGVMILAGTI